MYNQFNYNPNQFRLDSIDSQIRSLEAQKAMLTQQGVQTPTINTYVNTQPQQNLQQYDFNGIWASGIEEAKKIANTNLPTIIMDRDESKFYMRNLDGSFKAFSFSEIEEAKKDDTIQAQIDSLKQSLASLSEKLGQVLNANQVNTQDNTKVAQIPQKVQIKKASD